MKIFVDTAKLNEIETAYSWGVVDGITTNPSLINEAVKVLKEKGENIAIATYISKILETAKNSPVSLEVIGLTEEEMFNQAKKLYDKFNSIANNVVIKIPVNPDSNEVANFDGLKVTARLSREGIPINSTLIMTPEQALLAAKAGAVYVSPFVGRIDDYLREKKLGWKSFKKTDYYPACGMEGGKEELANDNGIISGVDLIKKIMEIFAKYNFKTEVIAASIRNSRQVWEVAQAGAHIATIPFSVLEEMTKHYKTAEGIRKFSADIVPEYKNLFE